MDCPCCDGYNNEAMGVLGNLLWFRCRFCGINFNTVLDKEEQDEFYNEPSTS